MPFRRTLSVSLLGLAVALASGCAGIVNRASQRMADNLTAGILNQQDVATAREGIPAYLLLIDGLIEGDPTNRGLLLAGARLYGAYGGALVEDPARAKRLSTHAFDYARRAVCSGDQALCGALDQPFEPFAAAVAASRDPAALFALAGAWAGRIQANAEDWNAIADIPKVQALLERVVALDPVHAGGEPYLYLGVLATLRPASLGGQPEQGKAYFEKALALSQGRNQMVRVLYAEKYARLVFDRELHDRLLREAIEADPRAPGLTLINTLAQQRATALLASGDDYF